MNNSVTLQVGSATRMEISKAPFTNDQLHVTGTLNRDGALIVTNLGGELAAGDAFTLFQAGAFAGAFASYSLPPLNAGLAWDTNALGSGVLSVVQMVATNPTDITTVVAADRSGLTVSWPGDHTGWRLETNAAGLTRSDSWFTLEGSMDTNEVFLPFDPASSNVFFRLVFP